jgi:hypothetical protein
MAVLAVGGLVLTATAPSAQAADGFVRGSAAADASSFGLSLKEGAGTVGLTWGASSTSFREAYATASAKPLDLQLVRLLLGEASRCSGDTSPLPLPDSAIPAEFVSNSLATTAGTTVEGDADFPGLYGTPSPGTVGHGSAFATATPSSTASTRSPTIDLLIMQLVNPSTRTETNLVDNVRTATATSRADKLVFLWGALVIDNPTWTATVKTGGVTAHEGSFTTTGGSLWGQPRTAAESMTDLADTAQFIQDLLGGVGLALDLPTTKVEGDLVSVSPLMIRLTDSPLGKSVIAPLLGQPSGEGEPTIDEQIQEALDKWAKESCDNKRYRQIAEILLGVLKGSGEVQLPIGGVTVTTDATPAPEFEDEPLDLEPLAEVEGQSIEPSFPDTYEDTSSFADTSGDYGYETADTDEAEPPAEAAAEDPGESTDNEINFAAPIAGQSRTVAGVTGGAGVLVGSVMIVLAAAGIVSERVLKARRLSKVDP